MTTGPQQPPLTPPPYVTPLSAPQARQSVLSITRCFDDAGAAFKANVPVLVVAALVFQILSFVSLFILCGPLAGGAALLSLRCLLRPDRRADLGDLFAMMHRFLPLVGVFCLTLVAIVGGLVLLVVPGLVLMTFWLFPYYLMVDKDLPAVDALSASWAIVRRRGFGPNFLLAMMVLALDLAPAFLPYVGFIVGCVTLPLTWLLVASAYIQQVRENEDDLRDLFPQGFPVAAAA